MIYDHILLKTGTGAPVVLLDGELAIVEADQTLYAIIDPITILPIPLDKIAKPATPDDPTLYLVKTTGGCDYETLDMGAGGRAFDAEPYRIPGVAPFDVTTVAFIAGAHFALFEIGSPVSLDSVRIRLSVLGANVDYGVVRWADGQPGDVLVAETATATGVSVVGSLGVQLRPGTYATFIQSTSSFTAQNVISGSLRGGRFVSGVMAFQYPVGLGF